MRVSLKWIEELMPTGLALEDLAHRLTMAGLEIEGIERAGDDHALEVNVTPNRPDCLSHLGIARELAAITGKPLALNLPAIKDAGPAGFRVEISDPMLCNRYAGRVIKGVRIGPSPAWMKERLELCGVRSINNVVDVTNYVLLEYGHPLHAFDLSTLRGGMIRVGVAGTGNSIATLDGVERKLPESALLIWDGERPVAVAGVMGGGETEVSASTTDIFLESAHFKPESVRRTSKALGLSTEASYRFERGTDIIMLEAALDRASALIAELAGGTVYGRADAWPVPYTPRKIEARYQAVNRLLGTDIYKDAMLEILTRLSMNPRDIDAERFEVSPPPYRQDMTREADVTEEIARMHGYGEIPTAMPVADISAPEPSVAAKRVARLKAALLNGGFSEAVNFSFMNAAHLDAMGLGAGDRRRMAVTIRNPLRSEDGLMRTCLTPALVQNFLHNHAHGVRDVRLFETARVFFKTSDQLPQEVLKIGGIMHAEPSHTLYRDPAEMFYSMKGVVETLTSTLGVNNLSFVPSAEPFLHPGKSADVMVSNTPVGFVGVLSPEAAARFGVKSKHEVGIFELEALKLAAYAPDKVTFGAFSRYPSVERDVALLLDASIKVDEVVEHVWGHACEFLEEVQLFDMYQGKNIPQGKRSLAFNIRYRAKDRTLTDAEVERAHAGLIEHVLKRTGGEVRGA